MLSLWRAILLLALVLAVLLLLLLLAACRGRLELADNLAGVEHASRLDLRGHQNGSESHFGERKELDWRRGETARSWNELWGEGDSSKL